MKIAIFCDTFLPNVDGVVISIINAVKLLHEKNEIYLFVPSGSKKLNLKNVKYVFLKSAPLKNYKDYKRRIPSFKKVFSELRRIRPDITHIHSIFGIGWEGLICSKLLKIPTVTTAHTIFPEVAAELSLSGVEKTKAFEKVTWKYMTSFLNESYSVITPSPVIKKELEKHKVKKRIYPVSNGVNTKKFPFVVRKEKNEPVFLSVGRLVESKHVEVVLKAFHIMKKGGAPGKLWIVGKGPEDKKLKKYVHQNKLTREVKFFGLISPEKVFNLYKKADVFLTASTIETEGITTLEAMSTGLPVVGVDVRATPFLVKKDSGFIAPKGDEMKISYYMEKLSKDFELRKKMGQAASKRAKEYDLIKMNKKLHETYKEIIERYKK